jgi:hypothetical protein
MWQPILFGVTLLKFTPWPNRGLSTGGHHSETFPLPPPAQTSPLVPPAQPRPPSPLHQRRLPNPSHAALLRRRRLPNPVGPALPAWLQVVPSSVLLGSGASPKLSSSQGCNASPNLSSLSARSKAPGSHLCSICLRIWTMCLDLDQELAPTIWLRIWTTICPCSIFPFSFLHNKWVMYSCFPFCRLTGARGNEDKGVQHYSSR